MGQRPGSPRLWRHAGARSTNGNPFDIITAGTTIIESVTGAARSVEVRDLYVLTNPAHRRRFIRLTVDYLAV